MNVVPIIDDKMTGLYLLKKHIEKSHKVEIQLTKGDYGNFDFEEVVTNFIEVLPNLKEITISPLKAHNSLEILLFQKEKIGPIIDSLKKISEEYQIHLNIIFPIIMECEVYKKLFLYDMKSILDDIKGYDVTILLENRFYKEETLCSEIEICKFFGDTQLKVCFSFPSVCKFSNMLGKNVEEYMEEYLKGLNTQKYVKQIHFGKLSDEKIMVHDSVEEVNHDLSCCFQYLLENVDIIPEINENEIKEIELLNQC